jgi:molecular chaperone GrpE
VVCARNYEGGELHHNNSIVRAARARFADLLVRNDSNRALFSALASPSRHNMDATNETTITTAEPSEIERLNEELRKEHERYLRTLADFENYRKRVERERAKAAQAGKREIILSLLEVLDGLERALQHLEKASPSLAEGVRAIHRKLLSLLEAHGVAPFESLGRTFDPALHEAIGVVESSQFAAGTVAEELQRGYRWDDELLRAARVRVAQ